MSNVAKPAAPATNNTPLPRLPRLDWHWNFGDVLADGEPQRLIALLTALLDTPALGQAAAAAGMSYRAAWGLLRRCETELGLPLVVMERGRGSRLSNLGESLLAIDSAARHALGDVHATWEARMQVLLSPLLHGNEGTPPRLQMFASHDLVFADWVANGRKVMLDIAWHGSEEALAALSHGECDIAGFHVPASWSAEQLSVWLGRWLQPRLHVCVPVMSRQQGLVVARGNPLKLHTLADIAACGARLVNRQRGSATRGFIDQLLAANSIDPRVVAGYTHEEFTHDAVAATVASGQADAGVAIEAAAARYDLDFVPLLTERYALAMSAGIATSAAGQELLTRLQGNTFRQRLRALPGYAPLAAMVAKDWGDILKG